MAGDRDRLVEQHLALVQALAGKLKRHLARSLDYEDLVAYGSKGLVEAAERLASRQDAGSIDGVPVGVARPVPADGIEVLEAEADGIDERVTRGARWIRAVKRQALALVGGHHRFGRLGVGARRRGRRLGAQ